MQRDWYVLQVFSGQEKKVKKAIDENIADAGMQDYIEEVLLPVENVLEVKQGQQKVSEKKLWPGYLLVKMALVDDSWMYIKNVNGVIDFLGGGKPVPLSDKEVDNILKELADKKDKLTQKHNFVVGDKVKIVDGVFVNFLGTVTEVNYEKGRLSVMVTIFDRDTPVNDLEFWQIEAITDEDNGEETT